MTQFKANSVQIGLGVIVCLLTNSMRNDLSAQNIPLDPGKIPDQIQQQNAPSIQTAPPKTDPLTDLNSEQINEVVNFAISTTSSRYPWLTNPTDKLTFSPTIFNPNSSEKYFDSDIRFAAKNPTIVKFTFGYFPKSDQFYWVLPNNQVAIETQGYQVGIIHQGNGTDIDLSTRVRFSRALTGNQVITSLPENFSQITNNLDPSTFSIQSTAVEAVNPLGTLAPQLTINSGLNFNAPNVVIIKNGTGSTNNPQGGVSNFNNLEAQNTPQIIQGFPTVNIQSLFGNGEIPFEKGSVVSESGLAALGLTFNTGATSNSKLGGFSSLPAVKILQGDKFDNFDLLQILTNPNLRKVERTFYYLNSLFWADLGQRTPEVTDVVTSTTSSWERLFVSRPVNQSLITYDQQDIKATYNNRFVNIGASISYSFDRSRINLGQSLNSTVGMLMGGAFLAIDPQNLQEKIDQGKKLRDERAKFTPLATNATSEQRQQINQRLNSTLFYSNIASALEQVSGNLTFASDIRPQSSDLFQIRTGLYRRAIQFLESAIDPIVVGDTVVTDIRSRFESFGPLTFLGTQIPRNETGFQPNQSFASETVLTAPNGQQFVQSINSSDPTDPLFATIPTGIRRFALAFDRIELERIDRQSASFKNYLGYISLPSVEATWAGSVDDFNYGISSGFWLNFATNTAGNVANNNSGASEPFLGAFVNAILSWSNTSLDLAENNVVNAVTTTSPVVRFNWNSAVNSNNAASLTFSYTYSRRTSDMNFSLTPGISLANQGSGIKPISFLQGSMDVGGGLRFRGSLEYDENLFWSVEATQALSPIWTVGAFLKNNRDINQGIDTRESASTYGVSIKYQIPQTSASIEALLGLSSGVSDLRIRGNMRF